MPDTRRPLTFERLVSLRYVLGAEGQDAGRGFIRVILRIAIGGVAVGVAMLLLALSIVRGFSTEIEAKLIGFGAHVSVENYQDAPLTGAARLGDGLRALPEVANVAPVISEFTLLRHDRDAIDGVSVWGTDAIPSYVANTVREGTASLAADSLGTYGAVIGQALAQSLGIGLGDQVILMSLRAFTGDARQGIRVKPFVVRGIYETSLQTFDGLYVFTDVEAARALLDYGADEVTRYDLMLHDVNDAVAVADGIVDTFGFPIMANTIYEVYRGLFAWVRLQENIIPLVISIIIIVAAFNIIGTLLMLILEKTHQIGILAGMGATRRAIQRLFIRVGLLIGGLGTGIGMVLALVLALLQQKFEIIPLPAEAYYMDTAPIRIVGWDFLLVGVVSLLLCVVAAYIPARVASRIEPIRAIRFR
ncbi:MAG: ABC transporter permease [Bacteroidota bacterium]